MKVKHTTPKGRKKKRDVNSRVKDLGVDPGNHEIAITEIVKTTWSKKEMVVGERIEAKVETVGYTDGTPVYFDIYETEADSRDIRRESFETTISGNKASITWTYPETINPKNNASAHYSAAQAYFNVWTELGGEMSEFIPIYSDLNIRVETENGRLLKDVELVLNRSDGLIETHTTDSSGMVKIKKLPPRKHRIKFPSSSRIIPEGETNVDLSAYPDYRNILALGSKVHVFKLVELFVYCAHKIGGRHRMAGNTGVFEIVPDNSGDNAYKDKVVILSRTATALTSNGVTLERRPDECGLHAFRLDCKQEFGFVPNIFSADFWTGLKNPKEYPITGLPTNLTIKCYRPDIFKLQIKFPPLGKLSGGSKENESTKDVLNDLKKKKIPKFIKESEVKKIEGWTLDKWPRPASSELPVSLFRNNEQLKIDFLKSVGAFIDLGDMLYGILDTIQKNVPKNGWYFEFGIQLLQGTFVVEWGWKEYKDYRAYYYVGANLDLKIVDVKVEIGFGVSGFSFKAQLFVALNGSVKVAAKISRYSPDGEMELCIPFGTEIIASAGGRVQLGCFLKLEGTVECGLRFSDGFVKFQQHRGWSVECGIKWTGVTVKVNMSGGVGKKAGTEEQASAGGGENSSKSKRNLNETSSKELYNHKVCGEKDLGRFKWPDEKYKYNPPFTTAEELHKIVVDKLTDGDNVRVKIGSGFGGNRYMDYNDVAKEIEKKIMARNDLRKDPKALDALMVSIKKVLNSIMDKNGEWFHFKHIDKDQFYEFLNGNKIQVLMDGQIDPLQEIINKNS